MDRSSRTDLSTSVDISEAAARQLKPDLSAVTAEIKSRVSQGEAPAKAVDNVVAETQTRGKGRGEDRK